MAVRRKQIRELVERLLAQARITEAPVLIERIAELHRIRITRATVDDEVSGFLLRAQGGQRHVVIGANKSHHRNRQRFTIAHELGHFFLHEGETVHLDSGRGAFAIDFRDTQSAKGDDNDEREANFFAAEILMPAKFLSADLKGRNLDLLDDDDFLLKLAKTYQVSVQALTIRLNNLGYTR